MTLPKKLLLAFEPMPCEARMIITAFPPFAREPPCFFSPLFDFVHDYYKYQRTNSFVLRGIELGCLCFDLFAPL